MRKLLLITTALVGFQVVDASEAEAAPVGAWVATTLLGSAAVGTVGYAIVAGAVTLALQIGATMLLRKLAGQPRQDSLRSELKRPTSLPAYRFVYGKTWAPGTPVAMHVKGRDLYICWLLNSRPSEGPFTIYFDKRRVNLTGDAYDFNGDGATGTNWPFTSHVRIWIGDGTQSKCPDFIVDETAGAFTPNDAWRGRTVVWAKLILGSDEDRAERWSSTPPQLDVDGNWSRVLDPRDGVVKFTRNQGAIVLDALRNNPICPYEDSFLMLDTFTWGADVAGQSVAVKGGGTIPRYRCDGVLVFSDGSEIEDQIQPLMDAGASKFAHIGGKLAFVPMVQRAATHNITDFLDMTTVEAVSMKDKDEMFTEGLARFPAPDRAYEATETPLYKSPGAQAADGGLPRRLTKDLDFVTDYRQAERVIKCLVEESRMQKSFSGALPPEYFELVSGSMVTLGLPAPYRRFNGKYIVNTANPAAGVNSPDVDDEGEETVSIYLPVTLSQWSDAITAWNAETEEVDMVLGNLSTVSTKVQPPASVVLVTGSAAVEDSGDLTIVSVIAAWPPSTSPSANGYEWFAQSRPAGGGVPRSAGSGSVPSSAIEDGAFSVRLPLADTDREYKVWVRTKGTYGASDWRESTWVLARGPTTTVDAPTVTAATRVSTSRIDVTVRQPNDNKVRKVLIYVNSVDNPLTATLLDTLNAGASVTVTKAHTGLAAGTTRYYFARSADQFNNISAFSDSRSATTLT